LKKASKRFQLLEGISPDLLKCGFGHNVHWFYVYDAKYNSVVNRYRSIDYAEDICKHLNDRPNELMDFRETRESYRRAFRVKNTKTKT